MADDTTELDPEQVLTVRVDQHLQNRFSKQRVERKPAGRVFGRFKLITIANNTQWLHHVIKHRTRSSDNS